MPKKSIDAKQVEEFLVLNPDFLSNNSHILDSIETIHPIIEIHNLVFNGDPPFGAELLANNAIHAGIVIGEPTNGYIYPQITDLNLLVT